MPPSGRDYPRLFRAMNDVLHVLMEGGDEEDALRRSFEDVAGGFEADKALLLLVEENPPLRLRASCVLGLGEAQVRACEQGESVKGVSSSVIRAVISKGKPLLLENPLLQKGSDLTPALAGQNYSVLCAPVVARDSVLAVMYFQNGSADSALAFGEGDEEWLQGYASALGQAFSFHFQKQQRERELQELLDTAKRPANAPELIGESAHTQALRRELHEVFIPAAGATDPEPLLILGERGTGKDLVARYLHAYSARRDRPYLAVNCAEITDEMAVPRFFGHRKGAYTGALTDEPGLFRGAHGGVLVLDEIAELSLRAQGTLLRVLENRAVLPVGETREVPVDVQVVLATNRDPDRLVAEGALKVDLYDRFRTQVVRLQPLRERPWDVPLLARHYLSHHERRMRRKTRGLSPAALRAMVSYSWPGNIRELARVCSLLVAHTRENEQVDTALLARCCPDISNASPNPRAARVLGDDVTMREAVRAFERELILSRLERHHGNVRAVRASLGLPKTTFHRYAASLGIRSPRRPEPGGDEA